MSAEREHYEAVLADLQAQRDEIDAAIRALSRLMLRRGGEIPNEPQESEPKRIDRYTFIGMSFIDAAKEYLKMVNSPQSTSQIAEALKRGGLEASSYNSLYTILQRRTQQSGDIVRVGSDWGLAEWASKPISTPKGRPPEKERKRPVPPRPEGPTLGDLSERILREANGPLHSRDIREKLADLGKNPTAATLASSLIKDSRHRFVLVGGNVFDLAERATAKKS